MMTNMILLEIRSWWQLWLFELTSALRWWPWKVNPTKSYVIPHPQLKGDPPNVPSDLEPAKKMDRRHPSKE
jgi:hypothetical protein